MTSQEFAWPRTRKAVARTSVVLIGAAVFFSACLQSSSNPQSNPNPTKLNTHTFTLPPGFEIELVAGPPLVDRPISAAFDEQGRLYVSDSSGSNEKVAVQLEKKPHRIVRLEDTDGDGKFDKRTIFADKMMFPEGTMWYRGSLYVAAPPQIWKLTDTDGDGVADKREVWFDGKTLTGCANDLHGPYLGPDGWIYWCKGAFAPQTYDLPSPHRGGEGKGEGGKVTFKTRAAHIFRARPDGSGIEPVMTGGMDNPVDVVFTPGGERIFTTTFFQFPGGGKRDGLVHAVYGGIYGKDWDVIYEPAHKWTGPSIMPVLTHLGPAAPCGLHRYESHVFGKDYENNIFACLFNLQKVTRHVLTPDGATFKSQDSDFVVSDNKDFHPTDVIEDADGSLLIVDTGGWYKLCCPTSQLVKPDVLGGIYRVRKKGMVKLDDPRGLKLDWARMTARELSRLLDDRRAAVRQRAIETVGANGVEALPEITRILVSARSFRSGDPSVEARRNAVWAATRIDDPRARRAVHTALAESDETVHAALHSVSVWRDREALPLLLQILKRSSPQDQRGIAEALGRIGDKSAVPALLAASGETTDRFLEHSLTYALIEIGDRKATEAGLKSESASVRRAALIALDQMQDGGLSADSVLRELSATDPNLRKAAWWIASRHPEWGDKLTGFLRQRMTAKDFNIAEREELVRLLAQMARSPAVQALLASQAGDGSSATQVRRLALQAMGEAGLREAPAAWLASLTKSMTAGDTPLTREAVVTARALRWPKKRPEELVSALRQIGTEGKMPNDIRLTALAAIPDPLKDVPEALFDFLKREVLAEKPIATRGLAAEVLSRARLGRTALLALVEVVPAVGPMEIERVLQAFAQSSDEEVGQKLVTALKKSPARTSLRADSLRPRLAKFSPAVRKQAEDLIAALHKDEANQQAKLTELVENLPTGDVRRGQNVFNSPKAACIACHAIGYLGGKIGPDLTRIGGIRTDRDLLESIVFPGASFVQGYQSVLVICRDGTTHNGIVKKDAADEIILTLTADKEQRIARADIEEMRPGRVSVMPSGLDQQLSRQELADLVAFLKACR
jgi:putative membrane-bound dehydrogenase-like protein